MAMAAHIAVPEATTSLAPTITPPPIGVMSTITALTNSTSTYFHIPPTKELVLAPLRYLSHAEHYLVNTFPRQVARSLRIDRLADILLRNFPTDNVPPGVVGQNAEMAAQAADTWGGMFQEAFGFNNVRSFGGMLSYMTSRWSIACFSMALLLNRVTVYAASRQRISLTWDKRLALRLIPILLFMGQIHTLLQAIRCQTSPDWSIQRYGVPGKQPTLDWSSNGDVLHRLSSALLFWEDDTAACTATGMNKPSADIAPPYGSFSLLWPTFLRLCLSHFVETFSCALQQRPAMTETGMSVFEHSLAFAEAEAMVSHSLGLTIFGASKPGSIAANRTAAMIKDAAIDIDVSTRPFVLDRVNVPVEVLLIALISCCNSLTANIIATFNKQQKCRLINTTIWGICFMTAFIWGFYNSTSMTTLGDLSSGFLRFPTVCIVGFIPHVLVIAGVIVCGGVYCLALLFTAMSLHTNSEIGRPRSFWERLHMAHENLDATIQLRGYEIRWWEDFYSAIFRLGFRVLSAASEAVFMNEGRAVEVHRFTWLEEERMDEFEIANGRKRPTALTYRVQEEYGYPPSAGVVPFRSGYSQERKAEDSKHKSRRDVHLDPRPEGVGAIQRTARFWLLFVYLKGLFFLIMGWIGYGIGQALDYVGITFRPRWLRRLLGKSLKRSASQREGSQEARPHDLNFWILGEDGNMRNPSNDAYDIEPEMRRRIRREYQVNERRLEEEVSQRLYDWWKIGGWWGSADFTGEFRPIDGEDEDATSMISMSDASSVATTKDDGEWESLSSGQVTPTQANFTRESTPFNESTDLMPFDPAHLARLLNPRDPISRSEAHILSSHLSASDRIMTRSQYHHELDRERSHRSRILLSRHRPPRSDPDHAFIPTGEEESEILEKLILERRARSDPRSSDEDYDYAQGPLCVVCQTSPRTIIAWPCRCLCVCEDCRVSLALNNFGRCVTCRRDVDSFVRLWVP